MTKQIRTLPPGLDTLQEEATFGTMWIQIGTLKLIRSTNAEYNVLCQFWGQSTPAILSTRSDTPNNQQQRIQKYNIKCPITFFAEYLQQMKNNLRLQVQNVGKISLDITKFLKKNLNIDSRQAFQHFKGFFQIIGKGNRKAGSLQIEMGCQFDPEIAIRQMGQQAIQEIRKSQIQNCPASKLEVFECCGHCQCVCSKLSKKIKKEVSIKQESKINDIRIPHSLDTKPRQQNQFNPNKYTAKQQQIKQIKKKSQQIIIKKTIQQPPKLIETIKSNKMSQKIQQFPGVPKILTYSNLRLNFDDPELQDQIKKQNQQLGFVNMHKKSTSKYQTSNRYGEKIDIGESVQQKIQIKSKPKITKQQLLKQFYGAQNSPFKLNQQVQNAIDDSYQKSYHKQGNQREKLSRVINLNQELEKQSRIRGPPLLIENILQKTDTFNENHLKTGMIRKPYSKSNLMLSLFIQIDKSRINLPLNEPFIIAYRPYGQKQRLTLGPNLADPIHILSNVGESQVKRMNKTPFILQFWTSAQNKFIGLLRIDLSKIKKGFILQDRLNQIAIKTNILPTVIQRGPLKIIDLSDKQIGVCDIYAAIGTANQLNTYLNQKQSQPKIKPIPAPSIPNKKSQDHQKQPSRPHLKQQIQQQAKYEHNLDNRYILGSFDKFLQTLYKNNNHIIETLNKMMNQQYISRQQFNQLGKSIGIQSLNVIFDLHMKIKKNQIEQKDNKQNIDFHQIADSFDDFIQIISKIREQFTLCAKTVKNLFVDPSAVASKIKQQSPMQLINKKKLLQIMQKFTKYSHPITQLLNKLNQYVNIDLISLILSNRPLEIPQLIHINKQYLNQLIIDRLIQVIMKKGFSFQKMQDQFQDDQVSLFQIFKWMHKQGYGGSLWTILHWIQSAYHNSQFQINKIKVRQISDYLRQLIQQRKVPNEIKKPQQQKQITSQVNPKPLQNESPQKKPQESQRQIKPSQQISNINPPQNSQNASLNNMLNNLQKNQQPKKEQIKQKIYKHLFSINPVELSLDNPIKGNCVVIYEFPFDQQQVKSKNFITNVDKHKYPLKMYGNHGFTIQESPHSYLGDNSLKFYVKIDKRIEYEGALPSDQLLIQPNTQQDKIIPLFSDRSQGIAGKIRLNIHFQRVPATQNALMKQTTYQLFLPKSGYINYSITCQIQSAKVRSQLNLKEQFYIALVFDLFYHNSSLRTQFPPFSSKLYSDSSDTTELRGSIKLSLNPIILQYLKSNTGRVSLNIIYYSKESGNFERKQVPYAVIQLPLINVIKTQGIKGDYAFKNKLGMFVTLANCVLKYEKDPLNKLTTKEQNDKGMPAYWLILNFLQFISFQSHKFNWIKIEFVLKGRKYATQKVQLEPYSVNLLNNSGIFIKFNQEDFIDTKVIPVTILTNTSQRLGIDINLKAISKDLNHKKYSINNQYYIVVNQSSKATKMRLGLKTYCFRGGPLISNFVNSLYQHLDTEVFQQMQLPKSIQNYEQMLNIFKNKLKLTHKGLQQALSQLDINKGKQKLNFEFFTNRTYYKLDFTPILAQTQADIDFICEQLQTQATKQDILQYFSDNKIKLQNFRPEFLQRFCFKQLNKIRVDKNVQFLAIESRIDLIAFVRKIKILEQQQQLGNVTNQTAFQQKILQITILEGSNFQKLYNGIKPNSIVRVPQLGLQSQVSHRNSSPYFNQLYQCQLDKESLIILRNLRIQVFHCTNEDDDAQNILIGQGYININPSDIKNGHKIVKVTLNSLMSNRMKANLNIKLGLIEGRSNKSKGQDSSRQVQQSAQASRIGEILHDIRQEMTYKNKLFESSDQQY